MTYSAENAPRQRASTMAVVVGLHVLLAWLIALWMPPSFTLETEPTLPLVSVEIEPPPPPVILEEPVPNQVGMEGEPSPASLEAISTPIIDPLPMVELPTVNPINVAAIPSIGLDALRGTGDLIGDGEGLGAAGNGRGAGDGGDGTGAGGEGTRAKIIKSTMIKWRDYPRPMRRAWPTGGYIFAMILVDPTGRPLECRVEDSIGQADIDAQFCRMVREQVRFRPARNGDGFPVEGWAAYIQYDTGQRR